MTSTEAPSSASSDSSSPYAAREAGGPRPLPAPVAFALERALRAVLALDPGTAPHLARLDGRVVKVNVLPLNTPPATATGLDSVTSASGDANAANGAANGTASGSAGRAKSLPFAEGVALALSFVDGRVDVFGAFDGQADVTLSGSPTALASMAGSNDALYVGDVRMEGDVGVASALSELIASLEVDVEDLVAPVMGGPLARRVGQGSRQAVSWLGRTRLGFEQNLSEYLKEEAELLPAVSEVEYFAADVDRLRADADRLEARIRRLERLRAQDREPGAGS